MSGLNFVELLRVEDAMLSSRLDAQGLFIGKTANQTIADAILRPTPQCLWESMWYAGEVCCLFSDSNLGKSILAVQIADKIARTQRVALFDFELSDKQFQLRYTSDDESSTYRFSDNLTRYEIDPNALRDTDFEKAVLQGIEEKITQTGTKVIIIDNLTYLCLTTEKGDAAGLLMMQLMQLKRQYQLSILVLAHTPKRPLTNPITQNDLAGSKKLYNFFDSSFAIGRSSIDNELRYVKQIKCRCGSFTYDSDNVIVYRIEKSNCNFLSFQFVAFATEREHLKEQTEKDTQAMTDEILELHRQGKSYREIATSKGVSLAKVQRTIGKNKLSNNQ